MENTILRTKEKIFDLYYETDQEEYFYWFTPKTKEQLIKIVENDYASYKCLVLQKGKELKYYDYLLDKEENLTYEGYTTTALIINEKIENSFNSNIKHKIERLFKI